MLKLIVQIEQTSTQRRKKGKKSIKDKQGYIKSPLQKFLVGQKLGQSSQVP